MSVFQPYVTKIQWIMAIRQLQGKKMRPGLDTRSLAKIDEGSIVMDTYVPLLRPTLTANLSG